MPVKFVEGGYVVWSGRDTTKTTEPSLWTEKSVAVLLLNVRATEAFVVVKPDTKNE